MLEFFETSQDAAGADLDGLIWPTIQGKPGQKLPNSK